MEVWNESCAEQKAALVRGSTQLPVDVLKEKAQD